jgi:DNA-binding transcriptional ArsR family regulator
MSQASPSAAAQMADAAPLFAALGDETRLRLVIRLAASGPESITHLSAESAVSRQAIKKHLDVLAKAGLVHGDRRGREHIWELETKRLDDAREYLDRISRRWDEALGRLKRLVEEEP